MSSQTTFKGSVLSAAEAFHRELAFDSKSVAFYKDEIKLLTQCLAEVASKNTSKEILSKVEQFQNQFILQGEQLDILKHDLGSQEQVLEDIIRRNLIPDESFRYHQSEIGHRSETATRIFAETKNRFYRFLSEVL